LIQSKEEERGAITRKKKEVGQEGRKEASEKDEG